MAKKKKKKKAREKGGGDDTSVILSRSAHGANDSEEDIVDLNFKVRRSLRTAFKRAALDRGKTSKELLEDMIGTLIRLNE
jgi:hypothetical protein